MRSPSQCRPNTGWIRFFPILSRPGAVKHIASLHGFAVCDEALHNCRWQLQHLCVLMHTIVQRTMQMKSTFGSDALVYNARVVKTHCL